MNRYLEALGAPLPGWLGFVLQQIVLAAVAGAVLGYITNGQPIHDRRFVGRARRWIGSCLPLPARLRGRPHAAARVGLVLGAIDGIGVVALSLVLGRPLPIASGALVALGSGVGLGALAGALALLPGRRCRRDPVARGMLGGALGLVTALAWAAAAAFGPPAVALVASTPDRAAASMRWALDAISRGVAAGEPAAGHVAPLVIGLLAGHVRSLAATAITAGPLNRVGTDARLLPAAGGLLGVIAMQAGVTPREEVVEAAAAAVLGMLLAGLWSRWRQRDALASVRTHVGPDRATRSVATLAGALVGLAAAIAWIIGPLAVAALASIGVLAAAARTEAVRRFRSRAFDLLPVTRSDAHPALQAKLTGTTRLTGLLYGTNQLAWFFPGLILTLLVRDLQLSLGSLILVMGTGTVSGSAVALYRRNRGGALPPRARVGAIVVTLGLALVVFATWPSPWTLGTAMLVAGATGPSALLVRRTVARQFPGQEGMFLGRTQTWTFLTSGVGGFVFVLAAFGVTDWRGTTAGFGVWIAATGLFQAVWRRLPRHGESAPEAEGAGGDDSAASHAPAWRWLLGGRDRDWRLRASPTLIKAVLASVGIYGAFQVVWSRLQPEVAGLGFSETWASVIVAVLGFSRLNSIPWIRKHGTLADANAKASAAEASPFLLYAAVFGVATLFVDGMWSGVLVLGLMVALTDVGGNATSTAVTTTLTRVGGPAEMMAALARNAGGLLGAAIAAAAGPLWPLALAGFALLTRVAAGRWDRHPTRWPATCVDPSGEVTLTVEELDEPDEADPAQFKVVLTTGGEPVLDPEGAPAFWHIWYGDRLLLKGLRDPGNQRSERITLAEVTFVWPLVDPPHAGRGEGRLRPGIPFARLALTRVPVLLRGKRRATLKWDAPIGGTWRRPSDNALALQSEALHGFLEVVHTRHGESE